MATSLEKFIALYGNPEQPAPAASTILGNVTAAPAPTAKERIAENYARGRPAEPPSGYVACRPSAAAPAPTPEAVRQAAERDAAWPVLTGVQKFARTYGPETSETLPSAGPALHEYRQRAQAMGVDEVSARKCLDAFLSLGDEPPR